MGRKPLVRINFGDLFIGYRGINNEGRYFTVVGYNGTDKNRQQHWQIMFDSEYTVDVLRWAIYNGLIKDKLSPTCAGVGMFGYAKDYSRKEYVVWVGMISRCYNSNDTCYHGYGALGISVCKRWHRFDYFLEDLPYIEGFDKDLFVAGKLDLDKDKKQFYLPYDKRVYSLETCSFITRSENLRFASYEKIRNVGHPVTSIDQFGNIVDYTNKQECIQSNNISEYLLRTRIDTNQPYQGNRYYSTNDTRIIGRQNIQVSKVFNY